MRLWIMPDPEWPDLIPELQCCGNWLTGDGSDTCFKKFRDYVFLRNFIIFEIGVTGVTCASETRVGVAMVIRCARCAQSSPVLTVPERVIFRHGRDRGRIVARHG